ncbi:CRISPR-associated protein Cas4 [Candidatus Uabimicrobium sp. HlEnr_7]|uniref:CRISPR-associated protein Cas4 n=1 Tax=Candidatus Uabimicrobium helgolandensis TaxID=3095367 RepID=UPI0035581A3F
MKEFVTPSEVIEYLYCPRFTFFMNVLKIKQHEEKRTLVNKGRDIHLHKLATNKEYLRKKIGCISKETDVYLSSVKLRLVGKVDEILFFHEQAAPLDYKYTFWENKVYLTLKMQQTLYAMLIEEHYGISAPNAYLVYIRSKSHIEKIAITSQIKKEARNIVEKLFEIIDKNYYPKRTKVKSRCFDCTYKNICTQ